MQDKLTGILVLNKPVGMSSRVALDMAAARLPRTKIGHTGTLDPAAAGVLVACLGRSTRLSRFVQQLPKRYIARVRLGVQSSTNDLDGDVESTEFEGMVKPERLQQQLDRFIGETEQRPPDYSAVHVQGQRAYRLARRGAELQLDPRPVVIHSIECLEYCWPDVVLDIRCGSGTYIRSLARDLGSQLGCGGLLAELSRTAVGHFSLENAVSLDQLRTEGWEHHVLSPLVAVKRFDQVRLADSKCRELANGVFVPCGDSHDGPVAIVDSVGNLVAVAEENDGLLKPRVVVVSSDSIGRVNSWSSTNE